MGNDRPVLTPDQIPWMKENRRSGRFLVGVSGGADSVALLCLLHEGGFRNLMVCHLNHGLRGRESAADAGFVGKLAAKLGYVFESEKSDVRRRMKETSESMETAARAARHEFFARCAGKHRCKRVLLAHHAEDQAETILWNLFRGSDGPKGMRETQIVRRGGVDLTLIRPLLGIRRAELVEWLTARKQKWREDSSNQQPVAVRNRLRHELMPLLREITGRDPVPPLVREAEDALDRDEAEQWMLASVRCRDPQGRLHLPTLRDLPLRLQRLAFKQFLNGFGITEITRDLLCRCVDLIDPANPASINLPGGRRLRRREGRIWIEG